MGKTDYFRIAFCLSLLLIAGLALSPATSYGADKVQTVTFDTTVSYDIWCNALGVWTATGAPGSYVNFYCSKNFTIDPAMKLTDVKVEIIEPLAGYKWYNMCVTQGTVKTISFNSSGVDFSVGAFLVPTFAPVQLMRFSGPNLILNGYRYYFNVRVTLTYEGDPDAGGGGASASGAYTAAADLFIPETGYSGHRIILQDLSGFTLGDRFYTAYMFYKNGLGTNSYSLTSGPGDARFSRCEEGTAAYYSDRIGVFDTPGDYSVRLTASVNGGMSSTDSESITILPVPEVKAELEGIKTALLKQTLYITEALDPGCSMDRTEVEIRRKDGSECVTLTITPDGRTTSTGNTAEIKARDPVITSIDGEFAHISLEFITKNKADTDYVCTVTVYDTEGKTDCFSYPFTVRANPGVTVTVGGDKSCTRRAGSDTADVNLKDLSDYGTNAVERTWEYYNGFGWTGDFTYTDTSLGSGKTIVAQKEGVGKARYRLTVKPVYNGDNSLPEFISESDRVAASAVFETEVINIQPFVSFRGASTETAEILVLYDEDKEAEALAERGQIASMLAQAGISADVKMKKIIGKTANTNKYGDFHFVESPFSYRAQYYSYEDSNFISDSERMYHVEATYGSYGGGSIENEPYPEPPYYVKAYDIETGEEEWTAIITGNQFDLGNSFTVNQDDAEDCLYLSNASSTLVLSKDDGSIVTTLPFPVGNVYKTDSCFYSVEGDRIRKVSLATGSPETVFSGNISAFSEMMGGYIHFAFTDNTGLRWGKLDPDTGEITVVEGNFGPAGYACLGFDIRGYMLVGTPRSGTSIVTDRSQSSNVASLLLYDEEGSRIMEIGTGSYTSGCFPVKDVQGRFGYAICSYESTNQVNKKGERYTEYNNNYSIKGIYFENSLRNFTITNKNYPLTTARTIFGYCTDTSFTCYTASNYGYAFGSELTYNNQTGTCRITGNTERNTWSYSKNSLIQTLEGTCFDYGYMGEYSGCMQITDGRPSYDGIRGSATAFAPYYRTPVALVRNHVKKYLQLDSDIYNGIFVLSASDIGISSTEKNRLYNVDNGGELRASVNDFISYLSSRIGGGDGLRLIYDKGETVNIVGDYTDYEGDPSKKSCYVYYHYPYNDGPNPQVNYITDEDFNILGTQNATPLGSPLTVFYYDGMYKVEHWQYDDTGNPDYDRMSNVATLIFFIRSGGVTALPSVDSISVSPSAPREGQTVTAYIDVSDSMGGTLSGKAEIFKDGVKVGGHSFSGLTPDYPTITFTALENAEPGQYTIICHVSDGDRQNVKSFDFTVLPGFTVTGTVTHSAQWNINRGKYNRYLFGTDGDLISDFSSYSQQTAPRLRGSNVFWSEEKLMIRAAVEGDPVSVSARIKGSLFSGTLVPSDETDEYGRRIYTGSIWSSSLKGSYGKNGPEEATVSVTACYDDGTSSVSESVIIFDDSDDYWRVHKLY